MNHRHLSEFNTLIIKAQEAILSDKERILLNHLMKYPKNQKIYFEIMKINCALRQLETSESHYEGAMKTDFDMSLWLQLANDEKTAPGLEIEKLKTEEVPAESLQIKKMPRKINKYSLYTAIISTAALIFLILFPKFAPEPMGFEVATLTDSINTKWANNTQFKKDSRILTSYTPLFLKEGLAEFLFFNNARIVIEAPAKFQVLTGDRIKLFYGRVYATIPQEAIGFTVNTASARIVDLGTEFGVEAFSDGTTELHIVKGRTTLVSSGSKQKTSISVTEGVAKKVSGVDGKISDIVYNQVKFARKINVGDSKRIWRGENLKLASIIAGYDGFHEVSSLIGLDPTNGRCVKSIVGSNRTSNNTYSLVEGSDFIDGIFVPDGGSGAIQITSSGQTFDCPNTSGVFTHEIAAYKGDVENQHTTIPQVIFNGRKLEKESVMLLHSNIGITFDLQAIRNSLPQLDLKSLKACGVLTKEYTPDIDFWILVDGQIRYQKERLMIEDGSISFEIEFHPQDRFLTLIVTESIGAEHEQNYPFANDFFYLIDPQLCLMEIRLER